MAVYGIPYLEPDTLREPWGLGGRSHEAALSAAMTRIRTDLSRRPGGTRSVVLAHAFVAGGEASDSERDISVGGVSLVPTGVFDGVDYVALGHLHGRHTLSDRIRYSGSPLAYSFSEADHLKGSWVVDLDGDATATAEFVEAPVPRPLARLRGELESLLTDARHNRHEASYVQVTLTDADRPPQAMERLRTRFPFTLVLAFEPAGGARDHLPRARTSGRSDHDIALDFVADLRGAPASEAESLLLREAVDACCDDPERDVLVGSEAPA